MTSVLSMRSQVAFADAREAQKTAQVIMARPPKKFRELLTAGTKSGGFILTI
ncbi:MAG: hypothetical protein PHE83_01490 [Opitutaceae bacterium]|nr:hypothetical protein [Opitutaceae bacterium]